MVYSAHQIIDILNNRYPGIGFLESEDAAIDRYRKKGSLILEFFSSKYQEQLVLKFVSLQKTDSMEHLEGEKNDVLSQIQFIQSFGNNENLIKLHEWHELTYDESLIGIYLVMEKLPYTIEALFKDSFGFTNEHVFDFLIQMDNVLHAAHSGLSTPIIHCDIKPQNIGIRTDSHNRFTYILMDFDIAVHLFRNEETPKNTGISNVGEMRGLTPAYAAPEQVISYIQKTGEISNRIDIYSVGAIAMQMLTGVPPQARNNESFYHLPWEHITGNWHQLFSLLCHSDPSYRVRRIMDGLHLAGFITEGFTPNPLQEDDPTPPPLPNTYEHAPPPLPGMNDPLPPPLPNTYEDTPPPYQGMDDPTPPPLPNTFEDGPPPLPNIDEYDPYGRFQHSDFYRDDHQSANYPDHDDYLSQQDHIKEKLNQKDHYHQDWQDEQVRNASPGNDQIDTRNRHIRSEENKESSSGIRIKLIKSAEQTNVNDKNLSGGLDPNHTILAGSEGLKQNKENDQTEPEAPQKTKTRKWIYLPAICFYAISLCV